MKDALKAARENPIADSPYEIEDVRVLVALCRELQLLIGNDPFFLSTRTAGRLLGVDHTTAWRWLFLLETDGWIKTVEKGGTAKNPRKATRYRYVGPPDTNLTERK
ncbi:MAG: hypothetical protein QGH60_20195 [Phycisphaerae bacterium]|jgi:hypothetical protein|nr:hypothetical protein [Phycisphaerae bacterium]